MAWASLIFSANGAISVAVSIPRRPYGQECTTGEQARRGFKYIRNHCKALNVLVHAGALPIDDNQVERLMKLIAIVRKNGWFIGSLRAGIRNATLMSLFTSE